MTVLEIVQNIASALDSDNVNSISDTVESYQIAMVVKETYYELLAALNIPSNDSLIELTGLADTTKPNYLKIPDTTKQIKWFKYDYVSNGLTGQYVAINYVEPEEFILRSVGNTSLANSPPYTQVHDYSGVIFNILNTQDPTCWTTFDNSHIVTDSWDNTKDTTLQASKTLCWGENNLTFTLSDTYTPVLDDDLFPLLLAEAKSVCFLNIKQMENPKEEKRAKRQLIRVQNDLWRADQRKPYDKAPDYGRRRAGILPVSRQLP
jgi:hypothetical protein